MKQLYSYPEEWLRQRQALHTAREIQQQPWLWRQVVKRVQQIRLTGSRSCRHSAPAGSAQRAVRRRFFRLYRPHSGPLAP